MPSFKRRALAFSIDFYLQLSLYLGFFIFSLIMDWVKQDPLTGSVYMDSLFLFGSVLWVLCITFMFQIYFIAKFGATPGKMALGLRIQDFLTGKRISFRAAFLRMLFNYISYFCGWLLYATAWYSTNRRHLGDQIARSIVVTQDFQRGQTRYKARPILASFVLAFIAFPVAMKKAESLKRTLAWNQNQTHVVFSTLRKTQHPEFQKSVFTTAKKSISEARQPASEN
ncbi:MAG: RDD family protein [Pseudobdellovibrionaceae bacterium]